MRHTKTYVLEEEAQRIDAKLDQLAEEVAELESGTATREQRSREGHQLARELVGLRWALNPSPGEDRSPYTEVTLGALTAGEYAHVGDTVSSVLKNRPSSGPQITSSDGLQRLHFVAGGLDDAPWLDDGDTTVRDKLAKTREVAPQFLFWMERRVDELTTPDVEGNGFAQRVAEKTSNQTSN